MEIRDELELRFQSEFQVRAFYEHQSQPYKERTIYYSLSVKRKRDTASELPQPLEWTFHFSWIEMMEGSRISKHTKTRGLTLNDKSMNQNSQSTELLGSGIPACTHWFLSWLCLYLSLGLPNLLPWSGVVFPRDVQRPNNKNWPTQLVNRVTTPSSSLY